MTTNSSWRAGLIVGATVLLPSLASACASCGCTLSSDWESLGYTSASGLKLDLRYDYLNQDQLRSGSGRISGAEASQRISVNNGVADAQEVEKFTKNDYWTLGLDYSFDQAWGVNVQIPYIVRSHSTLGTASDGSTPGPDGEQYDSKTSSLGDIKVIGRYQGFSPEHNFGLLFGVKLATGSRTETGNSTDPGAPGPVAIDRGLQPGTGTTDAILGLYYLDALNKNWDYFVQGLLQKALTTKDDYRPGTGVNLNLGLRYEGFDKVVPQLQLNARRVLHDEGLNADTVSTGGTLVYLSPGASVPVGKRTTVYGFVQLPIYQNVNGVQLVPRYTASVGARFAF